MTLTAQSIIIGMGEIQVVKNQTTVLTCLGLGSCIALCAYDGQAKAAGMIHMVLPRGSGDGNHSAKYVDSGVPMLIDKMLGAGAARASLVLKIAGGSKMLSVPGGANSRMDIGNRNIEEVRSVITKTGLRLEADDTGGTAGRTVLLFADSGRVTVKKVGGEPIEI